MRTTRIALSIGIWLIALGVSLPAQAIDPALRCEADKLREAGKHHFCQIRAESRAIKRGTDPSAELARCDARYGVKWPRIETRGGLACPTNGDEASIQTEVIAQVTCLATLLSGGSPSGCASIVPEIPATGQTTCWDTAGTVITCAGTGQDGDIQAGAPLTYQDNGDGTLTDLNTGLMWEKLSSEVSSIHNFTNSYTWDNAFALKVATLNSTVFAGHTDWRLPNVKELISIVDYELFPSVSPAFNNNCVFPCTVLECSCTPASVTWSSSTNVSIPANAWRVVFNSGGIISTGKIFFAFVRAVRGP